MDPIRTLLLARAHTVVLDPESVASAATRPMRADDVERFEDELAQLGFVMSLDLGMALRRLPREPIQQLRTWVLDTLGTHRPKVPLVPAPGTLLLRRMLSWLYTRPEQPCPWCGQIKRVGALAPCGHLVCRTCWDGGTYAGCPICHHRIAPGDPFAEPSGPGERVTEHDGTLTLLHLGLDPIALARARFERLLSHTTPLSPDDRAEVELLIDTAGPRAVQWLPARIAARETMAIAVARLWIVAPDRTAMVAATEAHVQTATDVARIAAVLMGGNAGLVEPMRLRSLSRGLRRAVLGALDRLPAEQVVEDVLRHARLWQRLGERLHPYEHAARTPTATLAFTVVRDTDLSTATFGPPIRAHVETIASVRIADDRLRVTPWAGAVEDRLREGDARAAVQRLAERPSELLRRVDHVVRTTAARQPDALPEVLAAIGSAVPRGSPAQLLLLASHLARRTQAWPRRIVLPHGDVLRAWVMPDQRAPLHGDAIGAIVAAIRAELVNRAAARRNFARAVIDRGLAELPLPMTERAALRPRGASRTRPTLWDVACIHAAARATTVYVRDGGAIAVYRRRDKEAPVARLARLLAGSDPDGALAALPPANAPTWFALLREEAPLPAGSTGYVVGMPATALVAELAAR